MNLFIKSKIDKNMTRFDIVKVNKAKKGPESSNSPSKRLNNMAKTIEKPRAKHIKEEQEIDRYNSCDHYYKKHHRFVSAQKKARESPVVSLSNQRGGGSGVGGEIDTKAVRFQVSSIYKMLNRRQRVVNRDRDLVANMEREFEEEVNDIIYDDDMNQSVNRLIKRAIVDTYDSVRKNKKANTLKMFVCSAKNYLKKTKKI